eukprot:TRINITY_DN96819_c0_g1_i1.p1 TRINITY_DN96819_c0_g1~~TRINITY_DN96819_c0_g1_i1.p1  ORF type:complete len:139 (+),score=29.19 TRINITY_DN96819_c0_g1_i1:58-417(+)
MSRVAGTKESSSRALALAGAESSKPSSRKGTHTGTKELSLAATSDKGSHLGSSLTENTRSTRSVGESSKGSDKFLVGIIGAVLMVLQVVVLIGGLTAWLRVENQELAAELKKLDIERRR